MKNILKFISALSIAGLLITGCSELRKDIPNSSLGVSVVHGPGFTAVGDPNFHGNFIRNHGWDMAQCQQCHGTDFAGGNAGQSCMTSGCHTAPRGPEACNTCHGSFNDPSKIAPPRNTDGFVSDTSRGVGAHWAHLYTSTIGQSVQCQECHTVPSSVYQPGHLDTPPPAEIKFNGPLGNSNTALAPVYNATNKSCANTYCHGNFTFTKASAPVANQYAFTSDKIEGDNFTPTWLKPDTSQVSCGTTCHSLPPKGHFGYKLVPALNCGTSACHTGIVDDQNRILDKTKHINGLINLRGQ